MLLRELNEKKGMEIRISEFDVCHPCCLGSTDWNITDNYIHITNVDENISAFVVIKPDNASVKNLLDSIILISTQITDSIKAAASYDCEDILPGGIGAVGDAKYFNYGITFDFYLRDSVGHGPDWKGYYQIFQCEQKLFVSLVKVLNKLIIISIENPNPDMLIPEFKTNGCDCKEFHFGRIFVD